MKKHNYPHNRAKRDTSYSKGRKLLAKIGIDKVKEILSTMGQYNAAKKFTELGCPVSPYVVYYLRKFVLKMEAYGNGKAAV